MTYRKKFNRAAKPLMEYHLTLANDVCDDPPYTARATAIEIAQFLCIQMAGFALGSGDKRRGSFDAAVAGEPRMNNDGSATPTIKIFASPLAMSKIQAAYKTRISGITRVGRWNPSGFAADTYEWVHPRGKTRTESTQTAPQAAMAGYT